MNKFFTICETCYEQIYEKDIEAAKMWLKLCEIHMEKGYIAVTSNFPEIRKLEMMGFVISTERSEKVIIIKVSGCYGAGGKNYFCVRGGLHD